MEKGDRREDKLSMCEPQYALGVLGTCEEVRIGIRTRAMVMATKERENREMIMTVWRRETSESVGHLWNGAYKSAHVIYVVELHYVKRLSYASIHALLYRKARKQRKMKLKVIKTKSNIHEINATGIVYNRKEYPSPCRVYKQA